MLLPLLVSELKPPEGARQKEAEEREQIPMSLACVLVASMFIWIV